MEAVPHGASDIAPEADAREVARNERAVRTLLRMARRAKRDPLAFFELVVREEHSGARLRAAPHQRVLFSFVGHHRRSVLRLPVGASKTYSLATLSLWLIGNDPTERGAIISASEEQAKKPLSMVQDYVENADDFYPELHLVFPELRRSSRRKDAWQQKRIVVERPPGIRDASLLAVGYGGKLPGSRLSWILIDDILTDENTKTAASRQALNRWVNNTVLSREDVRDGRVEGKIVVANTPWSSGSGRDHGDLTYSLEASGWPTLTMSIDGDVTVANADPDWDSDDVRPAFDGRHPGTNLKKGVEVFRLAAHDSAEYGAPAVVVDQKTKRLRRATDAEVLFASRTGKPLAHRDLDEVVPLWPEKFSPEVIEELRKKHREQFAQLYRCVCRDDESALCKVSYVEKCKLLGYRAGFERVVREYRGSNPTVTGIDLAFGLEERHDWTAFFTVELIPSVEVSDGKGGVRVVRNARRILDVEYARLEGTDVRDKAIDKARRYRSFLKVETNGGQKLLLDMILERDASIPVLAHSTGANKHHRHLGVVGLFAEMQNGAWLIPTDANGEVDEAVQRWIDDCLEYAPNKHAGDGLMASWIARSFALEYDDGLDEDVAEGIASAIALR